MGLFTSVARRLEDMSSGEMEVSLSSSEVTYSFRPASAMPDLSHTQHPGMQSSIFMVLPPMVRHGNDCIIASNLHSSEMIFNYASIGTKFLCLGVMLKSPNQIAVF